MTDHEGEYAKKIKDMKERIAELNTDLVELMERTPRRHEALLRALHVSHGWRASAEFAVLMTIVLKSEEDGNCYMFNHEIADAIGVSGTRTIERAVRVLVERGIVLNTGSGGRGKPASRRFIGFDRWVVDKK